MGQAFHSKKESFDNKGNLSGLSIAILATDGVEQAELSKPMEALKKEGAEVDLISLRSGSIQGWDHQDKGDKFKVDKKLSNVDAQDYDALVLPGGVANPDALRMDESAVAFVKSFVDAGKPIAAICHGPWTLIEAGGVQGKEITSWPSLKTDLINAGATWIDKSVVRSENLVTSRKPADLSDFNREFIALLMEGEEEMKSTPQGSKNQTSVAPSAQI
jgi:protease I